MLGSAAPSKLAWDINYSKTGELLLWGPCLWDPRAPKRIHRFDVFGETWGSSTFHPAGLEAILNTEVSTLVCILKTLLRSKHREYGRRRPLSAFSQANA